MNEEYQDYEIRWYHWVMWASVARTIIFYTTGV